MTEIIVDNGVNDPSFTILDLSRFSKLQSLEIGNSCFIYVKRVKMIGMNELERIVVGENSLTESKSSYGWNTNRHFYLRNCPKLKSLKMGRYSFSDYSVCIINGVPSLEVIEMGELNEESFNFYYASLELKSILTHSE